MSVITPDQAAAMIDVSWRPECLPIADLRRVTVPYHNFQNEAKMGTIVINKALADEVGEIFTEIDQTGYKIKQIKPIEDIVPQGIKTTDPAEATKLDEISMQADNTSGFNCRSLNGAIDKHGLGDAIDINPLENPMVADGEHLDTGIDPEAGKQFVNINNPNAAILTHNKITSDKVIAIFKSKGWRWGGDWRIPYDRQHFDKVPAN